MLHSNHTKILLLAGMVLGAVAPIQAAIIDSFENPPHTVGANPSGWGNNEPASTILEISDTTAYDGTQSVYMEDNSSTQNPSITRDNGSTLQSGSLTFAYRPNSGDSFRIDLFASGGGTKHYDILFSGQVGIRNPGGAFIATETYANAGFNAAAWNLIKLAFNEDDDTASIWVNGNLALTSSLASIDWSVGRVGFHMGYSSVTGRSGYVDAVALIVPEPGSMALLAPLVFACIRRR